MLLKNGMNEVRRKYILQNLGLAGKMRTRSHTDVDSNIHLSGIIALDATEKGLYIFYVNRPTDLSTQQGCREWNMA